MHLTLYTVIDARKKRPKDPNQQDDSSMADHSASLFVEQKPAKSKSSSKAQNRLTQAQLKELEAQREKEVLRGYRRLKELWPVVLGDGEGQKEAETEWIMEAEKITDTFRETRNLFMTTRVSFPVSIYGRRTWR